MAPQYSIMDVVCSCYDERNGKVQTIEHDIEMNINVWLLNIPSWMLYVVVMTNGMERFKPSNMTLK
jgi:hypothetical protein